MSLTIDLTIGTDRTLVLTVNKRDATTGVKTRQDLTGSYIYFRALRDEDTDIATAAKDNDPAGANVGILLRNQVDPDTRGQAEIELTNPDYLSEAPGSAILYAILVRLDPTGIDVRYEVSRGGMILNRSRVVIP
jgi:hypothetical protein